MQARNLDLQEMRRRAALACSSVLCNVCFFAMEAPVKFAALGTMTKARFTLCARRDLRTVKNPCPTTPTYCPTLLRVKHFCKQRMSH